MSMKCPRGRPFSTGPFRASGTSGNAWIKNARGEKIVDFNRSNLHVMSYSVPVRQKMSLGELKKHIYTLPDQPDLIPYRTSYYAENWAFCMPHRQFEALQDETYEVLIDSSLADGHLTYGRISASRRNAGRIPALRACLPSLARQRQLLGDRAADAALPNGCRACAPATATASCLLPGTIGAITWLARNENSVHRIKHGLVVSMLAIAAAQPSRRAGGVIPISTGQWSIRLNIRACRRSSRSFRPTAMTSGSTARRASTCRSGCFSAASSAPSRVSYLGR